MSYRQLSLTQTAAGGKPPKRTPRGRRLVESEAQVQAAIIERLTVAGYIVASTSRVRRGVRCACGRFSYPSGGDGVTRGLPDLFVSHQDWPAGMWIGIEVKGTRTAVSADQRLMAGLGRIFIVRNQDDADRLVRLTEQAILGRVYGRRLEEK